MSRPPPAAPAAAGDADAALDDALAATFPASDPIALSGWRNSGKAFRDNNAPKRSNRERD